MTLASGGSLIFLCVVHQPASPSIRPAVHSLWRGRPQIQGDNVGAVEEMMCVVCVLQRGHRDKRCVYKVQVCFYVCCSDCVGVCGNVCCVAVIVKDSVFLALEG